MRPLSLFLALLTVLPAARAQMPADTIPPPPTAPLPATNYYEVTTPRGRLVVHLFDDTPVHRDNFKRLVQEAFYDSTTFHRVIEGFMIQGGDPNTRDTVAANDGQGDPGYSVPAEIGHFHFRGALAAARQPDQINPRRASSGSQFYLVQGRAIPPPYLAQMQDRVRLATGDPTFTYPPEAAQRYAEVGGTPFLDGQYTVFGELVEGFDVLDALAAADTPRKRGDTRGPFVDRPAERLWMVVRPLEDYVPPAQDARE
jgi:peptidyl-prolyl cis-trans isomerase B (cyclophilin B)